MATEGTSSAPAPIGGYVRARPREGPLSRAAKFFQALGALPDTFKNFAFGTFLLFYYNQILGLPAFVASVALAAALILDAACDPLIGSFSDNLRTRLGRRHLLMYASAVPLAVGLYLAFSPPKLSHDGLALWMFAAVAITNISMSLFLVPWTALYAEFSEDFDERTEIVVWRSAVGGIGGLAVAYLTYGLIFPSTPAHRAGQLNPTGYPVLGAAIALAVLLSVLFTTHLTRGEIPYLLQPAGGRARFGPTRILRELGAVLKNPDFLVLFIGLLISAGVGGTTGALGLYVQTYFWGLTSEDLKWFGFLALGAVVAFLVLGRIERRLDKKTVMLVSFGLLLVDGFTLIGLRLLGFLPANGDPALLVILVGNGVWTTFIGTILGITVVSMLADTLDSQELRTGLRQEGIFAAALAFSGKATHGVGAIIGGLLLQKVIGWPTHADPRTVDPALVTRLGVVAGVVVPLFFLVPLAVGTRYRITRETFHTIRAALDRRREAEAAMIEARMSAPPPIA